MKIQKKAILTRRAFIGTTAAVSAASLLPFSYQCKNETLTDTGADSPFLNSNFGGVQIGAITYSWRSMPGGAEEFLGYCVRSGISSIEMMGDLAEQYAGCPHRLPSIRSKTGAHHLTDEEQAEYNRVNADALESVRKWRLSAPMDKFEELRKMYNNAGVDIHIIKLRPATWTDEEIDYAFNVAKILGCMGVNEEIGESACRRLGPFAEKHNMYAIFHTHGEPAEPGFSFDPFLSYSNANMINLDVGHYYGATGVNPVGTIEKYHNRIASIHLKDKTGPETDPPNANQVWGQGETPLREVLLLLKEHAGEDDWPKYADIELEYPIPVWSDAVKEVEKCLNYAKCILMCG